MWWKRTRPAPEELVIPNDIHEAVAIREQTRAQLDDVRQQTPFVTRMTDVMIDRQGKNHYIELLYQYVPREVS